uniref:Uncharacterized protein n=1 Tax=Pyxicephalus adspersus TaxID=30357 RepID=A0AAV3AHM5_PYXAD|nr:TPA: hypothetical protein GDO54_011414 [Pyxicephalus adspersus]
MRRDLLYSLWLRKAKIILCFKGQFCSKGILLYCMAAGKLHFILASYESVGMRYHQQKCQYTYFNKSSKTKIQYYKGQALLVV